MPGEFGGADAEDFVGVEGLGDGAGDSDDDFELASSVGDALFEGSVKGLKLTGHGFELRGEVLDLVAGASGGWDGTEVSVGDASRGRGEVAQATGGAYGREADEGGGEQGGAEEGDEDQGAGTNEGFSGSEPGAFDKQAPAGHAQRREAGDALGADEGAAQEGAGRGLKKWLAGLAGGRDVEAELAKILVKGNVRRGVDKAERGVWNCGQEVLEESVPGGFIRSGRGVKHAEADERAVGDSGNEHGLAVRGLKDLGKGQGPGIADALEGCGGWGSKGRIKLMGGNRAGGSGNGGALEDETRRGGGDRAEVGAEGVGEGAFDGVGEGEGAIGFGLEEGLEPGVLVEEEGEDSDGEQDGGRGDGGQDGDLAGQGAGPATAGPGGGALLQGAASGGRVD